MALPAICEELKLRADGTVALADSRYVADRFGKRHDHVLDAIRDLITKDATLNGPTFRAVTYTDQKGEQRACFEMNREGFSLLAMGFNGIEALRWKREFYKAFDLMEAALHSNIVSTDQFLAAVREIVAPLGVRFDSQDSAIEGLHSQLVLFGQSQADLSNKVDLIWKHVGADRQKPKPADVVELLEAAHEFGGLCPLCSYNRITNSDGSRALRVHVHHVYAPHRRAISELMPICIECHDNFHKHKTISQADIETAAKAFHDRRNRRPLRQQSLILPDGCMGRRLMPR